MNFWEYAYGGDLDLNDRSILPSISMSGEWMTLSFPKAANDLAYIVEYSYDLKTWHRDADMVFPPGAGIVENQQVDFHLPDEKKFFVRVVAE